MLFCKAKVPAVKAKTDGLGISFSIGEGGILQTQVGASASARPGLSMRQANPLISERAFESTRPQADSICTSSALASASQASAR